MRTEKAISQDELLLSQIYRDLGHVRVRSSPLGLLEGDAGRLLFMLEYAHYIKDNAAMEEIASEIAEAFAHIAEYAGRVSFAGGLLGFVTFLDYFNTRSGIALETDSETENLLLEHIMKHLENDLLTRNNYDFMIGAVGAGHYLLRRNPDDPFLKRLIYWFDEHKVESIHGITWSEPEGLFPEMERKPAVNLGLAHGVLPVILFLSRCFCMGIEPEKSRGLAEEAIRFVLHQKNKSASDAFLYPAFLNETGPEYSRHGWCYGDLGIAMMLLQCAADLGQEQLLAFAEEAALHSCLLRDPVTARIEDAAICHGSAGLYLQYRVLANYFSHPLIEETAQYWKEMTLGFRCYDNGPGGFMIPTRIGMQGNPGFLGGTAGIGLSFLYEQAPADAPWLRFLLLPEKTRTDGNTCK